MPPISFAFIKALEEQLGFHVEDNVMLTGGCINQAAYLLTSEGPFFLKWNDATMFPQMFEKEALALKALECSKTVRIPQVIATGEVEGQSYLLLEYLEKTAGSASSWRKLGEQLAYMHQANQEHFGWESDNYIGSLPQRNRNHSDWITFFREERLQPQVAMAAQKGIIRADVQTEFDLLYDKLPILLPKEAVPSLLHGDLWSGNVLMTANDTPYLVDPAVHFGHREAELAFTRLFGSFPDSFYSAYESALPLEHGHRQRTDLFNLYPLLVHLNLFGEGYLWDIKSILRSLV